MRCLLACCHQIADFDIQSTSISTVLDLINLTLSVNPAGLASTGVIVIPILTIEDVVLIEKSDMYKVSHAGYLYSFKKCVLYCNVKDNLPLFLITLTTVIHTMTFIVPMQINIIPYNKSFFCLLIAQFSTRSVSVNPGDC